MEYPSLHTISSYYSAEQQRKYKGLFRANLILLCIASLASAVSTLVNWALWIAAAAILGSFFVWLAMEHSDSCRDWFFSRAIAESIKTMAWRYAMKAPPYAASLSKNEAVVLFEAEIEEVVASAGATADRLDFSEGPIVPITTSMNATRELNWQERKECYLEDRVKDQRQWYSKKAEMNRDKSKTRSNLVLLLQGAAIALVVFAAIAGISDFSGFVLTLTASLLAWIQMQQHSSLSISYGSAAKELALIEGKFENVQSEEAFVALVDQAELAMSREHTLWVSRNAL